MSENTTRLKTSSPIDILLVDDSPDDVDLVKEALKENKIFVNLQSVGDGLEALRYLRRGRGYESSARPDLIILDLNMPRMNGIEVLAHLKTDECLMRIPVIVLTTSRSDNDIIQSYNLHANCFISKPINFDEFITTVRSIADFWLSVVKLPPI